MSSRKPRSERLKTGQKRARRLSKRERWQGLAVDTETLQRLSKNEEMRDWYRQHEPGVYRFWLKWCEDNPEWSLSHQVL